MSLRLFSIVMLVGSLFAAKIGDPDGVVVHEWGTFTSVAGPDGGAVEWLPLNGPPELPGFVRHLRGGGFKIGLRGTVRMETPVLYFYSARATEVSVKVDFPHGLITEWYPAANKIGPDGLLHDLSLYQGAPTGQIEWSSVRVLSANETAKLPSDSKGSHYYTARNTHSNTVRVLAAGEQQDERFLFYRGVAVFEPPISVKLVHDRFEIKNSADTRIAAIILFENHNGALAYSVHHPGAGPVTLERPKPGANMATLQASLEQILVENGLFADEAQAMVETWRDSWFENGTRVFYVMPRARIDALLPLAIEPNPAKIERVFVGRIELVTPETDRRFQVIARR